MNKLSLSLIAFVVELQVAPAQSPSPEPGPLTSLRAAHKTAMQRAAAPLISTYLKNLESLKQQYTRAGNLEAAVAVDAEIKLVRGGSPSLGPAIGSGFNSGTSPADEGVELITPELTNRYTLDSDGVLVTPNKAFATDEKFKPPVEITIVAKTDKMDLRMSYAASSVIFNWERNPTELRVDGGPASGVHKPGAGAIPLNKFVTIKWVVSRTRQIIYVDGEERYKHDGDYSDVENPVAVMTGHSIVHVQSLKV